MKQQQENKAPIEIWQYVKPNNLGGFFQAQDDIIIECPMRKYLKKNLAISILRMLRDGFKVFFVRKTN